MGIFWVKPKIAAICLNKTYRQLITDYAQDRKANWRRRFKKLTNGRLLVNVKEYRGKHESNSLTRKKIEEIYFELLDSFQTTDAIAKKINKIDPSISIGSANMYFSSFSFARRKKALSICLILRKIKRGTNDE